MESYDDGGDRCPLCGALMSIPRDTEPHVSIQGAGGQPTERVLLVDGREVHRCALARHDSEFYPGS